MFVTSYALLIHINIFYIFTQIHIYITNKIYTFPSFCPKFPQNSVLIKIKLSVNRVLI